MTLGSDDDDEAPGLAVGAGGGEGGRANGVLDESERDGLVRKVADGSARRDAREELLRAASHLGGSEAVEDERLEAGGVVMALL